MPSVETKIWMALNSRLITLPFSPKLPIVEPGSAFTPNAQSKWLSVGLASQRPTRIVIGAGPDDRRGTMTVTYVAPLNQHHTVYTEAAAKIAEHFSLDTRIKHDGVCLRIIETPHVVDGYREDAYWRVPVNIRWETFA
jgi:hypothetical protein